MSAVAEGRGGVGWNALRALAVLGGGVGGFLAAAVISLPVYGVLGPIGALIGANKVVGATRPWVGEGPAAPVPLRSQAVQWAVLGVGSAPGVALLLWNDPRAIVGDRSFMVLGGVSIVVPLAWWLVGHPATRWGGYAASTAILALAAIATYRIGGLGFLGPAFAMAVATVLAGIDRVRTTPRVSLEGAPEASTGVSWEGWTRAAVWTTLGVAVAIVLARALFAPAVGGDPAAILVFGLPAALAALVLRGRPRLILAAAVACSAQAALGFYAWLAWVPVAEAYGIEPGPPAVFHYAFLAPALLYWAAWRGWRSEGGRGGLSAAVVAGVLSLPPVAALTATREWGCGGNNCTDDFISGGEGLVAMGLVLVAFTLTVVIQRVQGGRS